MNKYICVLFHELHILRLIFSYKGMHMHNAYIHKHSTIQNHLHTIARIHTHAHAHTRVFIYKKKNQSTNKHTH